MAKKILKKELIVTTKQRGLGFAALLQDFKKKTKAQVDHPTISPNVDPPVGDVLTDIAAIDTDIAARDAFFAQYMAKTVAIENNMRKVKGIFVSWSHQIEDIPGITIENVKLIEFGIKGVYDGHSLPDVTVHNSHPVLTVTIKGSLTHEIHVLNSKSLTVALPFGAAYCDVYETFVEANCTNLKKMSYVGRMKNGKCTSHHNAEDIGKNVWYVAVYVFKAGVDGEGELSQKVQSTVV